MPRPASDPVTLEPAATTPPSPSSASPDEQHGSSPTVVLVSPPPHVRAAKAVVEGLRRFAPWLMGAIEPIKPRLSGVYYAWVNRHERLSPGAAAAREARRHNRLHRRVLRAISGRALPAARGAVGPSRIVQTIGTLGAGGAERQLVALAAGITRRGPGRCRVVTVRALVGGDGHYVPALRRVASLTTLTPWPPERAAGWMRRRRPDIPAGGLPTELLCDVVPLMRAFESMRPDVVHAWLDWTCVSAGLAAALLPVRRIILSTRNLSPPRFPRLDRPFFRDVYALLLEDPRVLLINNSAAGAADYAAWLGIDPTRIAVVRNGVDLDHIASPDAAAVARFRNEIGARPGQRIVAGVFRLAEEKAPQDFVAAAHRILAADPTALVIHAGDGPDAERVRTMVAAAGLEGRLRLLGRRTDVPVVLAAADVVLLCSAYEGTPNVLIEAQHLGRPVVATRAGGAEEAVLDGQTGILRDVGDVEGLAEAVLALLRDEGRRRAMGQAGPGFVAERFGFERMVEETMGLYG